jgi:Methyltransferase FkbM domain
MNTSHLNFLKVYSYDAKIRLGINSDGGYVIGDLSGYDCYVSAGIAREESFTREFIKRYGMNEFNSFALDSTIEGYPVEYTHDISYIKKNISNINSPSNTNLSELLKRYKNIFIKMDIEGGEYPWLDWISINDLKKIKQIVIECHGIHNDSWGCNYEVKTRCFEKLAKTHYLIHAHGNNARGTTNYIPNVLELAYIRKEEFLTAPKLNTTPLPISNLDYPNHIERPDYPLGMPPFTNA